VIIAVDTMLIWMGKEEGYASPLRIYPNPFTGSTTVEFSSATAQGAEVTVYDRLMRPVKRLFNGTLAAGVNRFSWDGKADNGSLLPAGFYVAVAVTDGHSSYRTIIKQ
jgi:flagellar hook assembly protein FlgD